jgi:Uma2 family endonuclease
LRIEQVRTAPGDAERFFEIVDGKRRPIPPPSVLAAVTATRLASMLGNFAELHQIGEAVAHAPFLLREAGDNCRMPDVAFVAYQRWPKDRPMSLTDEWWDVVPDLVAEVISLEERADYLIDKIADYFQAGVRRVWVIYPWLPLIHVYESLTKVRGLTAADELDGGAVLPGFRTAVAALFPEAAPLP